MQTRKPLHPLPSPAASATLTTPAYYSKPETRDLIDETAEALAVTRDGMIIQPALHNAPQPATRFAYRPVHSLSQVRFDRLEFGTHAHRH